MIITMITYLPSSLNSMPLYIFSYSFQVLFFVLFPLQPPSFNFRMNLENICDKLIQIGRTLVKPIVTKNVVPVILDIQFKFWSNKRMIKGNAVNKSPKNGSFLNITKTATAKGVKIVKAMVVLKEDEQGPTSLKQRQYLE